MTKQFKSLIITAFIAMVLPFYAFAISDTTIDFIVNGDKANVNIHLQHKDVGDGATALMMKFHLEAVVGSLEQAQVSFAFDDKMTGTVQRYSYNQEEKILTVYVAGAKEGIFKGETLNLGYLQLTSNKGDYIKVKITSGLMGENEEVSDDLQILTGGTTMTSLATQSVSVELEAGENVVSPSPEIKPTPSPIVTPAPNQTQVPEKPSVSDEKGKTDKPKNNKKYSSEEIANLFAKQNGVVKIDVSKQTKIDKEVFELLKNTPNTQLRLEGNGYVWVFDNADMKNTNNSGVDFNSFVSTKVKSSTDKKIKAFVKDKQYFTFETAYNGQLPCKAILELKLDKGIYADKTLIVYRQSEKEEPYLVAEIIANNEGLVSIPLEYGSAYFIIEKEQVSSSEINSNSTELNMDVSSSIDEIQDTNSSSSNMNVVMIIILISFAVIIVAFIFRNKKK